ncbi:MAG TPA: 50S ribosomal protein L9 [Desulfobacteraceae bacterium]|jgi:large subunit ribosomal protein L9|nr:50S ribosomal protein L9 [Desulfobacteraceae bacterium]HPJ68894.1 50S ribosomal protein L9 [Desulfobacteraceae bacterium]HPQ28909.1 50S ribosomal protein L9 [Desulfobacteraceae bacterium]
MEVILQKDVDELGLEGDTVNVAKGYARNYLIPKDIALEANPQNLKILESRRKKIEVRRLKAKEQAEKVKQALEGREITFVQKAGEEGKLYGSVTSMDIASNLEKQDILIDRRKILLEKPIKALGEYKVQIRVYPGVIASIKVVVNQEEEKEE